MKITTLFNRLFYETPMTWKRVLILSVLCGIIPGILMIPDFLDNTSLQQPGISFEFWIFMALLIVLNCKNPLEAGLKTFIFFLISQPLIYLVQVPFSWRHWELFAYYPRWGIITLLTFPGAMIAWLVKKQNWLSVPILGVANLILCMELPYFAVTLFVKFPRLLLTEVFIVTEIVGFILLIFKEKKHRIASFALALVLLIAMTVMLSDVILQFGS